MVGNKSWIIQDLSYWLQISCMISLIKASVEDKFAWSPLLVKAEALQKKRLDIVADVKVLQSFCNIFKLNNLH